MFIVEIGYNNINLMQKIQFLGASGGVTGSSYLVTVNNKETLLIDLGMFQGEDDRDNINFLPLPFDVKALKAVFVTHAHLDHCGRLPYLVKQGFGGKIYVTDPTKDIINVALQDAAAIAKGKEGPILYTKEEVQKVCELMEAISYDTQVAVGNFSITFRDAGHILGSASLEISEDSKTLVFSGDLGNTPEDLIKPTKYINHANFVVMETTYGDKTHPQEDAVNTLQQEINQIEKTGGVLLIPAFSIERSQEIVHMIGHLKKDNKINNATSIFLDSPMAIEVTEIFKKYPELYSAELAGDINPFDFSNLKFTKTPEESKFILKTKGAKVIIAGSGMMNGGRILHHIYNYISRQTTRVLIVGYQAVGTLGREILNGAREIYIYNKHIPIRATITNLESLSSHADQPKLMQWLKAISGVEKAFLVHGDDNQRSVFSEKIKAETNIKEVIMPKMNEEYEIN